MIALRSGGGYPPPCVKCWPCGPLVTVIASIALWGLVALMLWGAGIL